ncbi:MAG: HAMP domain-containing sensor histidine kinase [Oscillospiraceae bacterium]
MKTSIRTKLTALILTVCMAVIVLMWVMAVVFFKPMYYATTQAELGTMMSKVVTAIELDEGITNNTLKQISGFISTGVCIEISDATGSEVILFEGIGDACQLHGAKEATASDAYASKRRINTPQAQELREKVRANGSRIYNNPMEDELGNRQAVKGKFYDGKYCIIVSTNLTRTESIISIVTAQLRTASIIAVFLALIISAVMSNWFMKPIMILSNATKEIAKGNYKTKVEVDQDDELGQLAQDFNLMTQEIERSQQLQKELIASISHDLRTPLTIIKGYAESIKDITGDSPEVRNQQLTTIIDETDRLSSMVGSVLEYAKLNQGAYKLNIVQFDIADMCNDVVDIYSHKAKNENKTICYNGPESAYVFADAQMMERVIHNFVSNALVHTAENTNVSINLVILEDGKIKVSVKDSGEGIKPEDIDHLFDRYYRARKDSGKTGTGLGLAIVKAILENHNFQYGVNSQVGHGSEFWFIM